MVDPIRPKIFDSPQVTRLISIISEVLEGGMQIPAFQREFVWDDEQRLALLDSIEAGLPIGSLVVWKTTTGGVKTYDTIGPIRMQKPADGAITYMIDGHQRLATLVGALCNPGGQVDLDRRWPIYYDLAAPEGPRFRVHPRRGSPEGSWLPLRLLFDGHGLWKFTRALRDTNKMEQAILAERLANRFRDYSIPVIPLVSDSLERAADVFVRINSKGTWLDMMRDSRHSAHDWTPQYQQKPVTDRVSLDDGKTWRTISGFTTEAELRRTETNILLQPAQKDGQ